MNEAEIDFAKESLAKLRAELATVWEQHAGEKSKWVMSLKPGDPVIVTGRKREATHPFRALGRVQSVMPSFEMVLIDHFDVYSPKMVGVPICILFNGKIGRKTLMSYESLNIEPDNCLDERLGQPMDGHCGPEGLVEQGS